MRKCRNPHCSATADKESVFCLAHIERLSLHIEVKTPPPAETPQGQHDRIMARVHREQIEESES